MFCDNCGKKINKDAAFCNGCGTPVENDEEAATELEDALNHRLNNVIRLRGTMVAIFAGIFVFFGILGLFFAEDGMGMILIYPALILINAGIVLVPKFIAQYGSQGTFDPMSLTKGNMIVSFINIGAFLIMILAGDGHIISLLILIPDLLSLTQVRMIYSLAGKTSSSSVPKAESYSPQPLTVNANTTMRSNSYEVGQNVFARWDNGENYYPGIISAVIFKHGVYISAATASRAGKFGKLKADY
jgi:hypothetical protein